MQELISALTAHEEECSREFEADLSAFCTRHMDAQLVQQLQLGYAIGSLLLSTMPGMIADRTGSYAPAYLVLLACSVVSILAVQRTYLARAKS